MSSLQTPLPSGYGPFTTSADVLRGVDLTGRVAIVTGGYSGLGLETVRGLALSGARVIVPARDEERARQALWRAGVPAEVRPMDLSDPASIDRFAGEFVSLGLPLDILVNSAGIMALPERQDDGAGNELQFSTNHLGHFRLTARLWPALARAEKARVVSVSSLGHRFSPVLFDDPGFATTDYDPWIAYGQSKTANILFATALDAKAREFGVRAFSLHPGGIVDTGLAKHLASGTLAAFGAVDEDGRAVINPMKDLKSVPQGAATQIWCAVSPQLDGIGGVFCHDCDVGEILPDDKSVNLAPEDRLNRKLGVKAYAVDPDLAERLWDLSERLTGVRFITG